MISIGQRDFLEPLCKWRILDMESLISFSSSYKKYSTAQKMLWRLHKKKLIEIYRDPWNKKNYIYLGPSGIKELNPELKPHLNTGALYHDSKVSTLGLLILKLDKVFTKLELEHEVKKGKNFKEVGEYVPDARVLGNLQGQNFEAALELELTQKEKKRIIQKAKHYLESKYYNHAFYFFPTSSLLENYYKTLKDEFGIGFNKKIFLFSCPSLIANRSSLDSGRGFVNNKEKSFLDVFGGEN